MAVCPDIHLISSSSLGRTRPPGYLNSFSLVMQLISLLLFIGLCIRFGFIRPYAMACYR